SRYPLTLKGLHVRTSVSGRSNQDGDVGQQKTPLAVARVVTSAGIVGPGKLSDALSYPPGLFVAGLERQRGNMTGIEVSAPGAAMRHVGAAHGAHRTYGSSPRVGNLNDARSRAKV